MAEKPTYEELERRVKELEKIEYVFNLGEKTQKEAEIFLTKAQEIGKLGHFSYDPVSNVVEGSSELLRIFDVDHDMPLFEAFANAVHPEDGHLIFPFIDRAVKEGIPYDVVHRIHHKNGNVLYVHAKGEIINTHKGNRLVGIVQDITERKQAEEALGENEEKWRSLAQNAPSFITIVNRDHLIEYINHPVSGLELEEIIGHKVYEFIQPEYHDIARTKIESVFITGQPCSYESLATGPEGTFAYYDNHLGPIVVADKIISVTIFGMNITERKQAEDAVKESEVKYKSLIDNINLGVAAYEAKDDGKDFIFLDINKAGEKIDNIRKEDLIGRSVLKIFPSVKDFGLFDVFKRVLKTGKPENLPITYYKDERLFGWRDNYVFKLPSGEIVSAYSDETDHKQAEEALKKSEEKYREFVEGTDDLIAQVDHKGRLTFVNHKAEPIFGLSKEKCIGMSAFEFIHPDDRDKTEKAFSEWVRNGIQSTTFENRQVNQTTGKTRHMHWTINIQYDKSGNIISVNNIARDLTEKNRIENELRKSEERYHLATLGGNVGVWDWNLITGDMFISPNLKAMIGYEDHEIKNHIEDWGKNVCPEDVEAVMKEANACIEGTKNKYRVEHRMVHKDGSLRWFLASGRVERDKDGQAIRFFGTDTEITHLKTLEEKLRQTFKMEALGTLSGGIAHEFNNILGIIIGNTELAIDDVPEWNPAKDCLEEIRTASLRAKDVVRQIMSFARKTPSTRKPIQISTIIQESLKLIRATIPTNIEIRMEILCNDEMILANPTEVNQVLMNLCSNSVHAMEGETGVLKVRLETIVLDGRSAAQYNGLTSGEYVKLAVKDNGSGIDPKLIGLIFDPYFTTKGVDKGLGMGLAIVFGIVKKHDGTIEVNSKVGKGTTVEVLFPVTKETAQIEKKVSKDLPRGTERILFVDDEASLVKMVTQMLERQGYEVVGKTSSKEALQLFQEETEKFDLVITDMAMPDMTGDRLAQELIKIRPTIPIIICTGHSDRMDEGKAMKSGIAAYTMKPLAKTDLVNTVRKVLGKSKGSN